MPVSDSFIKIPTKDVLEFNLTQHQPEEFEDLFIYDIGGVELSQVTNYQTVYGLNIEYTTIHGLELLAYAFNPTEILAPRRRVRSPIDYNIYSPEVSILDDGSIQIALQDFPDDYHVEVQIDYNAIINVTPEA